MWLEFGPSGAKDSLELGLIGLDKKNCCLCLHYIFVSVEAEAASSPDVLDVLARAIFGPVLFLLPGLPE